jgi:ATP-dependent protease HslVU (ClpYQ) peptidase subunit
MMGGTGDWRMCQIVRFGLAIEKPTPKQSDLEYITMVVTEAIRKILKDHGYTIIKDSREDAEGEFLIAYRGELYHVDRLFAVNPVKEDFEAIGSGAETAIGALAILARQSLPPKRVIRQALKIAAHYAVGVGGPFHVEKA